MKQLRLLLQLLLLEFFFCPSFCQLDAAVGLGSLDVDPQNPQGPATQATLTSTPLLQVLPGRDPGDGNLNQKEKMLVDRVVKQISQGKVLPSSLETQWGSGGGRLLLVGKALAAVAKKKYTQAEKTMKRKVGRKISSMLANAVRGKIKGPLESLINESHKVKKLSKMVKNQERDIARGSRIINWMSKKLLSMFSDLKSKPKKLQGKLNELDTHLQNVDSQITNNDLYLKKIQSRFHNRVKQRLKNLLKAFMSSSLRNISEKTKNILSSFIFSLKNHLKSRLQRLLKSLSKGRQVNKQTKKLVMMVRKASGDSYNRGYELTLNPPPQTDDQASTGETPADDEDLQADIEDRGELDNTDTSEGDNPESVEHHEDFEISPVQPSVEDELDGGRSASKKENVSETEETETDQPSDDASSDTA